MYKSNNDRQWSTQASKGKASNYVCNLPLSTTLLLALQNPWKQSSWMSTAVSVTCWSATRDTSLQCATSLCTINKSSGVTCGSLVKESDSVWKWAKWAEVRRWGHRCAIYIRRGAESLLALGPPRCQTHCWGWTYSSCRRCHLTAWCVQGGQN